MFKLFGSKKKKENIVDLLSEFAVYQQLAGQIGKAQSLQKLNRVDEARAVVIEAERLATSYLSQRPLDKRAHMLLALFYREVNAFDRVESIIQRLLDSAEFQLNEEERLVLSSELQRVRRQRPASQRGTEGPTGFTQVYCCANCGRLHNFVSMPCPNCDWSPQTIEETARSIVLSNAHFKVTALLTLAREMANGRSADEIVPNLSNDGRAYLRIPEQRRVVEQVFAILRQNEHKNHRSLGMVRQCSGCGNRIFFSGSEECDGCGEAVTWPDAVRALVCMDNLLWLFERRIELSSADALAEFVCILVAMTNSLLRKQEAPSAQDRRYSVQLLADMGTVCDLNKGAIIETKDPKNLKIYLVKDSMREDSEAFGIFLLRELECFVAAMGSGVKN